MKMRSELKSTYKPIREWPCFVPKCKARTKNWHADGWWVTGFTTDKYFTYKNRAEELSIEDKTPPRETYAETDFARDELVEKGVIEASAWACSYVCPAHKDGVLEGLL
jgi:hypothetical protein